MRAHDKDISGKNLLGKKNVWLVKGVLCQAISNKGVKKLERIGFRSMPFPVDPAGMREIWVAHRF